MLGTLGFVLAGEVCGQEPIQTLGAVRPQSEHSRNLDQISATDPRIAEAKSLLEQNKGEEAERAVREYLETHGNSADGHFVLGYVLFRQIQEHAGVKGSAGSGANYTEKGATAGTDARFNEGKAKASLAEYTEGAKYRAPSAFDLKIVALDYVLLGDYADADKWLTKMLEWTPDDAEGWYYLGRTKYNENRFAEAVKAFQETLRREPKNVKAEDNLGLSYAGLGRNEEALAAYQNAIDWQKDAALRNSGPFIDMASLLLDLSRSGEAIPYLQQAIGISQRESKSHELLGKAHARLEQYAQAQAELEKAVELAPEVASLHCMLGPVYRKQGLTEKAKSELERCASLSGTHSSPETPRP
jgi:tetratricopeptide (TPR) repeat protein